MYRYKRPFFVFMNNNNLNDAGPHSKTRLDHYYLCQLLLLLIFLVRDHAGPAELVAFSAIGRVLLFWGVSHS